MITHECEYCGNTFEIEGLVENSVTECPGCHEMCDVIINENQVFKKPGRNWKSPGTGFVLAALFGSFGLIYVSWSYFLVGACAEITSIVTLKILFDEGTPWTWNKSNLLTMQIVFRLMFGFAGICGVREYNKKHNLNDPQICTKCGFNLDDIPESECPECNGKINQQMQATGRQLPLQ